ncbi:MAG: FkbM family methyltransferase [Vicinamibacterales bacterium]
MALKSHGFMRPVSILSARSGLDGELLETNMGLPGGLRLMTPAASRVLTFGRPDHYVGERATFALAMILARKSRVFIDVGANEGLFTYGAAVTLGPSQHRDMHLFEPDEDLFGRLSANLTRNTIKAHANQVAVSDRMGTQTFHRNLDDNLSGSLSDYFTATHRTVAVEVKVTTLADYLEAHDITDAFVKVDVEGAGAEVWAGAAAAAPRIKWLVYEMLAPEIEARLPQQIIAAGFTAYYIRDFEIVPAPGGAFTYKDPFYNWLFCRADADELAEVLRGTDFRVVDA